MGSVQVGAAHPRRRRSSNGRRPRLVPGIGRRIVRGPAGRSGGRPRGRRRRKALPRAGPPAQRAEGVARIGVRRLLSAHDHRPPRVLRHGPDLRVLVYAFGGPEALGVTRLPDSLPTARPPGGLFCWHPHAHVRPLRPPLRPRRRRPPARPSPRRAPAAGLRRRRRQGRRRRAPHPGPRARARPARARPGPGRRRGRGRVLRLDAVPPDPAALGPVPGRPPVGRDQRAPGVVPGRPGLLQPLGVAAPLRARRRRGVPGPPHVRRGLGRAPDRRGRPRRPARREHHGRPHRRRLRPADGARPPHRRRGGGQGRALPAGARRRPALRRDAHREPPPGAGPVQPVPGRSGGRPGRRRGRHRRRGAAGGGVRATGRARPSRARTPPACTGCP